MSFNNILLLGIIIVLCRCQQLPTNSETTLKHQSKDRIKSQQLPLETNTKDTKNSTLHSQTNKEQQIQKIASKPITATTQNQQTVVKTTQNTHTQIQNDTKNIQTKQTLKDQIKSAQQAFQTQPQTKQKNSQKDGEQKPKSKQLESIDYFGDISKSLKQLLKNSSNKTESQNSEPVDKDLIQRLVQSIGMKDTKDLKQEYQLFKAQQKMKEQFQQSLSSNLSKWVNKQRESSEIVRKKVEKQQFILQKFQFFLEPKETKKLFMHVPPGRPENYLFDVVLYWQKNGNYMPPKNPQEQEFLKLQIFYKQKQVMKQQIYVQKTFEWYQYLQNGNILLSFSSQVSYPLLVIVNLQRLKIIADPIIQKKVDPMSSKLKGVVDNTQLMHSIHTFRNKAELQYQHNRQHSMTGMFIMTVVQCLALIVVMLAQLFFLQKLINNNNIMV